MELEPITIRLPPEMVTTLRSLAAKRDVTLGQVIRVKLARDLERNQAARRESRPGDRLAQRLRGLLGPQIFDATSWDDLSSRLCRLGYELRPSGAGLALHAGNSGARLCRSSDLGYSYRDLICKFGGPMPHRHRTRAPQPAESRPEDSRPAA